MIDTGDSKGNSQVNLAKNGVNGFVTKDSYIEEDDILTQRDFRSDSIAGVNEEAMMQEINEYQKEKEEINTRLSMLQKSLANNDPQLMEKVDDLLGNTSKVSNIHRVNQMQQIVEEGEEVLTKRMEFEKQKMDMVNEEMLRQMAKN